MDAVTIMTAVNNLNMVNTLNMLAVQDENSFIVTENGKECEIMNKFGEFVCKYRVAIIILALLLLIPSAIGMVATRINYDILTYLPDDVATIQGLKIF